MHIFQDESDAEQLYSDAIGIISAPFALNMPSPVKSRALSRKDGMNRNSIRFPRFLLVSENNIIATTGK